MLCLLVYNYSLGDLMERSYQGCAGFLFLIGLSQEARSYYSTQRFEVIQAGAKRQVGLVIFSSKHLISIVLIMNTIFIIIM